MALIAHTVHKYKSYTSREAGVHLFIELLVYTIITLKISQLSDASRSMESHKEYSSSSD